MARTEHLPIYKSAYNPCLYAEQVVHGFSRYHRYILSADLRDRARPGLNLVVGVVRASARRGENGVRHRSVTVLNPAQERDAAKKTRLPSA
jgi:hypothetical protein